MPVYFHNPGELDTTFLKIVGLSVKETDNPIGRFGTGLKYAIGVLLRTGHRISLTVGQNHYEFTTREESVRGQEFLRVYMNDEPLPFAANLGRDWKVWQAYRELRSNAMDENGDVSSSKVEADTVFRVVGQEIEDVHANSSEIFLEGKPEQKIGVVEIHAGPGHAVYYRGIRVHDLPKPSVKKYNILGHLELTEDRTAKNSSMIDLLIARAICKTDDSFLASCALGREEAYWERGLTYHSAMESESMSREFREAAAANAVDAKAHPSAMRIAMADKRSRGVTKVQLNQKRQRDLDKAIELAMKIFDGTKVCDIEVVEDLGPGIFGMYKKGKNVIYLSLEGMDRGVDHIAGTIVEEWLHRMGHDDFDRGIQDWLLQRLIQQVK